MRSRTDSVAARPDAHLLHGDAEAFGAFYRRHEDAVLRYFARRTGAAATELAIDLTAETFARALTARAQFDPGRGEARQWLFGIARHVLAGSLERGRVQDDARKRLMMEPLVLDESTVDAVAVLAVGPAEEALEDLPPTQRDAIRRRVLDDASYAELASHLRCSESVARQRVSRGLRRLRQRLEDAR
jgi:RNA polymerase sigma-70 factor (ECF subfamily)